ncbi:hypothetical protein J2R76_003568 [Bradyrhizobium sp. USDA 4532]|nr:hypothetical protein [Bradyrhizobium sp. USDA 4532]
MVPRLGEPGVTKKRAGPKNGYSPTVRPDYIWDPRNQRPELWSLFNARVHQGESMRVFAMATWTELDGIIPCSKRYRSSRSTSQSNRRGGYVRRGLIGPTAPDMDDRCGFRRHPPIQVKRCLDGSPEAKNPGIPARAPQVSTL